MESADDEEEFNICLMENHQNNEVTFYFFYNDPFCICKKLIKETRKNGINCLHIQGYYFLSWNFKNLEKEIKISRERQNDWILNSSTSNEEGEPDKCNEYDTFKNEILYLQKSLLKLTKGRNNLNILLGNQRDSCNKVGLGHEPNNNKKNFSIICNAKSTSHYKKIKMKLL